MKKILIYSIVALILAVVGLSYTLHKETQEKARYKANQESLLADVEYFMTEYGKSAASVQKLTLTYDELKKNYDEVVKTANELKIKVKRLQSVSTSKMETNVVVKTEVRDSIVYIQGEPIRTLAFDWRDTWTNVDGIIHNDSVNLNIQSHDTIVQLVHRIPHKFWFIKWGCKAIRQDVVSKNPHTNITYTEYIELK